MPRRPVYKSIAAAIISAAREQEKSSGGRIRSFARLSADLGVSKDTIQKAVRHLVAEGNLCTVDGSNRFYLAGAPALADRKQVSACHLSRPESIAAELRAEILSGHYSITGDLPSPKLLRSRFSCSYPTLRSALGILVSEKLIVATRRACKLSFASSAARKTARVHLVLGTRMLYGRSHQVPQFISGLEQTMWEFGWEPPIVVLSDEVSPPVRNSSSGNVGGYVFFMHKSDSWLSYLRTVKRTPVIIVNHPELSYVMRSFMKHTTYFNIQPDNRSAARTVGQFIRARGVRQLAFFSHVPYEDDWRGKRLAGIRESFELTQPGERLEVRLYGPVSPGKATDMMVPTIAVQNVSSELSRTTGLTSGVARGMLSPAYEAGNLMNVSRAMRPLFEQARRECPDAAWVCINDDLAVVARAYLDQVMPAGACHLMVSFDNSPHSYAMGFSSYDLGYYRMGALAARCIAGTQYVPADRYHTIKVEGRLVTRN